MDFMYIVNVHKVVNNPGVLCPRGGGGGVLDPCLGIGVPPRV